MRSWCFGVACSRRRQSASTPCAAFGLMDTSEAQFYGLSTASLENASGNFVAPTAASLQAAAAGFTPCPDADLSCPAGTYSVNYADTNPAAYPMANLTYAIVPTSTAVARPGHGRQEPPDQPAEVLPLGRRARRLRAPARRHLPAGPHRRHQRPLDRTGPADASDHDHDHRRRFRPPRPPRSRAGAGPVGTGHSSGSSDLSSSSGASRLGTGSASALPLTASGGGGGSSGGPDRPRWRHRRRRSPPDSCWSGSVRPPGSSCQPS